MKKRKRHSPEQIIKKLRDADAMLAARKRVSVKCSRLGGQRGDAQPMAITPTAAVIANNK